MHYSRREEPFRYEFAEPIKGEFQITSINGTKVESRHGTLEIVNISYHGAKIRTEYNFQIQNNEIELTLYFRIMSNEFLIPGILVHQESNGAGYICGIHLHTDDQIRQNLIGELKAYAWKLVDKK